MYARVKGGREEARFSPPAQLALAPFLAEAPDGAIAIRVAGELRRLAPRAAAVPSRH